MNTAQYVREEDKHSRCSVCKIRSYSFCRCLKEHELRVFSDIHFF